MATVREQTKALRDGGADMVVAVTHTDFTRDLEIARSRLVDVLLTGHDHDLRVVYDNRTVMVESGEEGEYVTAIDIYATIGEREGRRSVTWLPRFRVIDSGTVTPDPEALAIVKRYETSCRASLTSSSARRRSTSTAAPPRFVRRRRRSATLSLTRSGLPPGRRRHHQRRRHPRQQAISGRREDHAARHSHRTALRQRDRAGRDHRQGREGRA